MDLPSRQTLLDVIISRYNNLKQKKQLSRVMYIATKINAPNVLPVKAFHENLFNRLASEYKVSEFPFGLLIESHEHCLHVLEGTTESIAHFLRLLFGAIEDASCCIHHVKILRITDDVGAFLFPRWAYLSLENFQGDEDEEEPQFKEEDTSSTWIRAIHITEHRILNIGKKILSLGPKQMDVYLSNATTSIPHLVPSPSLLSILSKCDLCFTLKDWIDVYDASIDIELDNEIVYPHPEGLKYINELEL